MYRTAVRSDNDYLHGSQIQKKGKPWLTSLTGAAQVASPWAVAHVAVPALPARATVQAWVAQALLWRFFGAGRFDTYGSLGLSDAPDVFALAVHEQVAYAAHVTIVEQCSPYLGGKHQASAVFWQTTQVQSIIQIQDLTLTRSVIGGAYRIDRDGTWKETRLVRSSVNSSYVRVTENPMPIPLGKKYT